LQAFTYEASQESAVEENTRKDEHALYAVEGNQTEEKKMCSSAPYGTTMVSSPVSMGDAQNNKKIDRWDSIKVSGRRDEDGKSPCQRGIEDQPNVSRMEEMV